MMNKIVGTQDPVASFPRSAILAPTEKSAAQAGLAWAHTAPPSKERHSQACTGWFIYKYTDVSSFSVVSIFCVRGKRQKVGEWRAGWGVVMW